MRIGVRAGSSRWVLAVLCLLAIPVLTGCWRPSGVAWAEPVTIARLKYGGGGDWYANPTSLPRLLEHFRRTTGLEVAEKPAEVAPGDASLFAYPLVYATGHGTFRLTDSERRQFRAYLERGGFFWADDNFGMDVSLREELGKLFPESPLVELPFDHPLYRMRRVFAQGLPKVHRHAGGPPQGLGIFYKGRLVVFASLNTDIGDGMEDPSVHGDPEEVRLAALDFGVNLLLYVLTQP